MSDFIDDMEKMFSELKKDYEKYPPEIAEFLSNQKLEFMKMIYEQRMKDEQFLKEVDNEPDLNKRLDLYSKWMKGFK